MFAEVDVTVTEDVLIFQMVMEGHLNVDWAVVNSNISPYKVYHSYAVNNPLRNYNQFKSVITLQFTATKGC